MITHQQFKSKWLGKRYAEPGINYAQCVGLAKLYCSETGNPIGSFGGSAITGWNTGRPFNPKWSRVTNLPKVFPTAGDVVFWNPTPYNKYGHVSIADTGCTTTVLKVVEQNGGRGSGTGLGSDAIREHTYNYIEPKCVGWFTLKK